MALHDLHHADANGAKPGNTETQGWGGGTGHGELREQQMFRTP
jgi:hypothetical protein